VTAREIWTPGTPLLVRREANAYRVLDDGTVSRTPARLSPGEALTVVNDHGPCDTLVARDGREGRYFVPRMDLRDAPDPQPAAAVHQEKARLVARMGNAIRSERHPIGAAAHLLGLSQIELTNILWGVFVDRSVEELTRYAEALEDENHDDADRAVDPRPAAQAIRRTLRDARRFVKATLGDELLAEAEREEPPAVPEDRWQDDDDFQFYVRYRGARFLVTVEEADEEEADAADEPPDEPAETERTERTHR
jgi:hypothetical protein